MENNLLKKLAGLNIVIASHIFATGPSLELEEYLKEKTNSLLFIGHPFADREEKSSFHRYYSKGRLQVEHKALAWNLPEGLTYLKDAFYTLAWVLKQPQKVDFFIGSDNFTAFFGLLAKKIGKVENVILYTIDYMPKRFTNPVFNFLYHYFDEQCLRHCKIVWNVSSRIAAAREEYKKLDQKNIAPQIVVPLGMWYDRIPKLKFNQKERYRIIFLGHLLEKQGLAAAIEALLVVAKKLPKVELFIIGTGPFEDNLKVLVERNKLDKNVVFLGYIDSHKEVEEQLAKSTIALATYKPDPDSFTYLADPGKIKNYLAAGLPVILTDVPAIAKELVNKRCGAICEYNPEDIAKKLIYFLSDEKLLEEFSNNARSFAKDFDWNKVFTDALNKSL